MKNYNSWQLLPRDYEGNKYALATRACRVNCVRDNTWRLCYDEQGNIIDLTWQAWHNISAPILICQVPCISQYIYTRQHS